MGGLTRFLIADHQGSILVAADRAGAGAGSFLARTSYDEYGIPAARKVASAVANPEMPQRRPADLPIAAPPPSAAPLPRPISNA